MIADAIKLLVELGRKSKDVQQVKLPGGRLLTLWGEDTEIGPMDAPGIKDELTTLADLERWLMDYATDEGSPVVFVSATAIKAIVNRELPHERKEAWVSPERSPAFEALLACKQPAGVKHREFVRMLRGPLAGTIDDKWLKIFRKMNFSRLAQTERGIAASGEKLGRSVETAAQSIEGELPETMTFTVDVWQLPELTRQPVRCAVEIDAETETIRLLPVADELEQALDRARRQIVTWLNEHVPESVSVFSGRGT